MGQAKLTMGDGFGPGDGPDADFSRVNLEYLIRARDLARLSPTASAALLGIPTRRAHRLARVKPEGLALLAQLRTPLLSPHLAEWWWERLLDAAADCDAGELQVIAEHAVVLAGMTVPGDGSPPP